MSEDSELLMSLLGERMEVRVEGERRKLVCAINDSNMRRDEDETFGIMVHDGS